MAKVLTNMFTPALLLERDYKIQVIEKDEFAEWFESNSVHLWFSFENANRASQLLNALDIKTEKITFATEVFQLFKKISGNTAESSFMKQEHQLLPIDDGDEICIILEKIGMNLFMIPSDKKQEEVKNMVVIKMTTLQNKKGRK